MMPLMQTSSTITGVDNADALVCSLPEEAVGCIAGLGVETGLGLRDYSGTHDPPGDLIG